MSARRTLTLAPLLLAALVATPVTAQTPRALSDAMAQVYRLDTYTAFDWIAGRYDRGTLTLLGFVRTPQLKTQAEAAARRAGGIDDIVNQLEVLPVIESDDHVRVRAYLAIYGSSALEHYAPSGRLSPLALSELEDASRRGLDASDVGRGPHPIHIVVSGARVLLLGQVRVSGDRRIAESLARSVPGVLGVRNQLRVAGER